jgi:isoquinoline 1-oxidoreductase beta subunit
MNRLELATRRDFLGGIFSAGALVFAVGALPEDSAARDVAKSTFNPSIWVGIDTDGTVTIVSHRSEMGTGIRTTLPMVVADELGADWSRVRVEQAIGDAKYGSQDTDGSQSIREFYDIMRETGASARLMLERAAAAQWNVPPAECKGGDHFVVHTSGKKLGYGELASAAAKQSLPGKEELRLKAPAEFRYIGKGVPLVDLKDICSGQGKYGFDAHVPGMVYASIERPPVLGGKLKSFDDKAARTVSGVRQTIVLDGAQPPYGFQALGGVAVIADNTWAASQGRKKLKIEWESGPHAIFDSASYRKTLTETANKPQQVVRTAGDVDAAFANAGKVVEANYYTPLLAHAPMEPPAALADFKDGKVEIWTATQNPQAVQDTVAKALGIKPADVTCHVTLLGGGFGRKSKPDYCAEAALLSRKAGKPVKVSWSREEALDGVGKPVAWLQRTVFPPIGSTFNASERYGGGELGLGFLDMPFDIPNLRAENGPAEAHLRIGWLRSVSNIYHAYGIQSFIDELAHTAGKDPIEYWLATLGEPRKLDLTTQKAKYENYGKPVMRYPVDTGRLRRVVETVAEKSGWGNKRSGNGHAWGFAAHRSFLSYVATVVEVEIDPSGKLRIPTVHFAVDCGQVIHPDRVKAQFEGAAVMGATIAMMGEITAADGRVVQSNFHNYPVARINEAPYQTHVHLLDGGDTLPTGTGEPGVPPIAPAICNAIFAATGKRIRELPVRKTKLA